MESSLQKFIIIIATDIIIIIIILSHIFIPNLKINLASLLVGL